MDSSEAAFWEQRYLAKDTPWDMAGTPPPLKTYLQSSPPPASVLIPGCGSGYEVQTFHEAGWQPQAIDFAATAVAQAQTFLGPLSELVTQADFFNSPDLGPFDFVYENTFLCALPPDWRRDYARRVHALLKPHGSLIGLFYYGTDAEGPPFPITPTDAANILEDFELVVDRAVPPDQSRPLFAGKERWQEWRKQT